MNYKTCFKCGKTAQLSEFYRHPMMRDGHLGKCKTCTKSDVATRRDVLKQDPEWIQKERERHREKFHRLHRQWNINKKARDKAAKRWAQKNKHKKAASQKVNRAVYSGLMNKPGRCQDCHRMVGKKRIQGHHSDYSKPLSVEWLCRACHGRRHRKP